MCIGDIILAEPEGGAQNDIKSVAGSMKKEILKELKILKKKPIDILIEDRYNKFRKMGEYKNDSE